MISPIALLLMIPAIFLGGAGSIFLKRGAAKITLDISKLKDNLTLIIGLFLFGSSLIFYMAALRYGELTILYPLSSLTYIVVSFFSVKYLKEKMSKVNWIGIALIIVGSIIVVI